MIRPVVTLAAITMAALPSIAQSTSSDLAASAAKQLPSLTETYKHFHRNPELSHHEEKTSALLAAELRKLGYSVTELVGKYADGSQAYGVVAILQNGTGPRLLIRADMDALPVVEKTGLDYASTVRSTNAQGQDVGVMHACGHDIHMTVLLGVAKEMAERKTQWHGTLMLIGQPSEETIDGARAMLADGLYERFGKPDVVLSEHDDSTHATGSVALKSGPMLASSTSIDVTMRGIGAHGSAPQLSKDPVLMAAEFIVLAQTIVARQIDPQQPAVLTVGMIHGGAKRNIIPEEVTMGLTLRTYSDKVRSDHRRRAPHRGGSRHWLWRSAGPHAGGNGEPDRNYPGRGKRSSIDRAHAQGRHQRAWGGSRGSRRFCDGVRRRRIVFAGRQDSGDDVSARRRRCRKACARTGNRRASAWSALAPVCAGLRAHHRDRRNRNDRHGA